MHVFTQSSPKHRHYFVPKFDQIKVDRRGTWQASLCEEDGQKIWSLDVSLRRAGMRTGILLTKDLWTVFSTFNFWFNTFKHLFWVIWPANWQNKYTRSNVWGVLKFYYLIFFVFFLLLVSLKYISSFEVLTWFLLRWLSVCSSYLTLNVISWKDFDANVSRCNLPGNNETKCRTQCCTYHAIHK